MTITSAGPLLIGTSTPVRPDGLTQREREAEQSLAALRDAIPVVLRFVDEPRADACVPALHVLTRAAPDVTGRPGPRKPIVRDIFDVLAAEAERRGCRRIAFVNGDIVVRPAASEAILGAAEPFVAISRQDVGGDPPQAPAMLLRGVDLVAVDVAFWRRERRRFRAYVAGEPLWDNVYAAIGLTHGPGVLFNRTPLIEHERHVPARGEAFADYLHLLATWDSYYFSRWCTYVDAAEALRARGGTPDEERALQRGIFVPPAAPALLHQWARGAWWTVRTGLYRR